MFRMLFLVFAHHEDIIEVYNNKFVQIWGKNGDPDSRRVEIVSLMRPINSSRISSLAVSVGCEESIFSRLEGDGVMTSD